MAEHRPSGAARLLACQFSTRVDLLPELFCQEIQRAVAGRRAPSCFLLVENLGQAEASNELPLVERGDTPKPV